MQVQLYVFVQHSPSRALRALLLERPARPLPVRSSSRSRPPPIRQPVAVVEVRASGSCSGPPLPIVKVGNGGPHGSLARVSRIVGPTVRTATRIRDRRTWFGWRTLLSMLANWRIDDNISTEVATCLAGAPAVPVLQRARVAAPHSRQVAAQCAECGCDALLRAKDADSAFAVSRRLPFLNVVAFV